MTNNELEILPIRQPFLKEIHKLSPNEDALLLICSDLGNAKRFVSLFGHEVKYSVLEKTWYLWTGNHFKPDKQEEIFEKALVHDDHL